ncbi:MAG: hypothetical protein EBT95_04740 [Verrucomicrobia bacterium]|nr:hypothetical protein [Verrucomicrobiota bacterium]
MSLAGRWRQTCPGGAFPPRIPFRRSAKFWPAGKASAGTWTTTFVPPTATLRQILARREGFRGNLDDYFRPANSYLHLVLETRLGIPLTLALVYIFVGQRAGLEVYGLNTPGHYLTGIGGVVFDPFHGGVVLSADDLAAKFGTERACWANPMFMRATPRETAERMLVNLLNSYSRGGDEGRHARTVSYLQMIDESLG